MSSAPRRFQGEKDSYRQLDFLGAGQTAEVYRVQSESDGREWALKLLGESVYHKRFFDEVVTLNLLAPHARVDNGKGGFLLVPEVVEVQDAGPDRFFVMTLARGQRLDELMLERGRLDEPEALTILVQTAQVFDALHQKLRRDYHDFQPRNVYWDQARRQVLVLDWNLLSLEGQVNVAGDVLVLGKLLYRMLVGEQLPALGVTAAPGWISLTLGVQTILRKATHQDAGQRYASVAALRSDCQQQLALWEMPASDLVTHASDAYERGKEIGDKPPGAEFVACKAALDDARNCMQILDAREGELGTMQRQLFLVTLRPRISQSWSENTQLATGQRFLRTLDSGPARTVFDEIISRSDDVMEKLRAMRWRLAAVVDKPSRDAMIQACELVEAGDLDAASRLLDEAAALAVNRQGAARTEIAALRADTDAQRAWRDARVSLARARQTANPQEYAAAAACIERAQQALGRLDAEQRAAYAALWGDIAKARAEALAELGKLNDQHNELQGRRTTWSELSPAAVIAAVEDELLTGAPGTSERATLFGPPALAASVNGGQAATAVDSRAATAALALEFVREWTRKAMTADGGQAELRNAVQLIEIVLPYVRAAERPQVVAEWRQLKAAAALLEQPQPPSELPAMQRRLDELVRAAKLQDNSRLAAYVLEQLMVGAENRLDAALAALVVQFAAQTRLAGGEQYEQRRAEVAKKLAKQVKEAEAAFLAQIDAAEQANTVETLGMAQQLIEEQLLRAAVGSDWRACLEKRREQVVAAQQVARLRLRLAALPGELGKADNPVKLDGLKQELITLRSEAERLAPAPGAAALAAEYSRQVQNIEQRSLAFGQFKERQQAAQRYYQEYLALRDLRQDMRGSPLRSDYALALLAHARREANEADRLAPDQPDIVQLRAQLAAAWQQEGGDLALSKRTLQPDAAEALAALQARQADMQSTLRAVAEKVSAGQQVAAAEEGGRRLPRPLLALLGALLLLGLAGVGLTLWLGSQHTAALAQAQQEIGGWQALATPVAGLTGLAADVAGVRAEVAALATVLPAAGSSEAADAAVSATVAAAIAPVEQRAAAAEASATEAAARAAAAEGQLAAWQTEQAASAPTMTAIATTLASFQEMNVTLTAQAAALETRTAELAQREGALAAGALSATATALAATPLAITTPTPAPPTPEPAAAGEPNAAVVAGATVTPTAAVAATITITPTVIYPVTIRFPAGGAQLYTAPWEIVINGDPWPEEFVGYRLYVNGALLTESARPQAAEPITVTRTIVGNWDGWAQMTPAEREALNPDDNGQLPPGDYRLRLVGMGSGGQEQEIAQTAFTILAEPAPGVVVVPPIGIARRLGPSMEAPRTQDGGIRVNTTISVLGKANGPNEAGAVALWCFWQTQDEDARRGWTMCEHLRGADGVTLDQNHEGVPWLAPPSAAITGE